MWVKVQHLLYGIILSFNKENNTIIFKRDYDHEVITIHIPQKNIIEIEPYINNGKIVGLDINVKQNLVDLSFDFNESELIDVSEYVTQLSNEDIEKLLNKESGWSDIENPEKYIEWIRGN